MKAPIETNREPGAFLSAEQQKKKEDDKIARAEERERKRKKIIVSVDFGTTNGGKVQLLALLGSLICNRDRLRELFQDGTRRQFDHTMDWRAV